MKKLKTLVLLLAVTFAVEAFAIYMVHPVGLKVWLPDDWKRKINGSELTASSPDSKAIVRFKVINANNVTTAIVKLDGELNNLMKNKKFTKKPTPMKLNGLTGVMGRGTGKINGTDSNFLVGCFLKDNSALMVTGFADKKDFKKHQANLLKIVQGIQPN